MADAPDPKTPAPTSSPAVIRRHAVLALAVGAVGWAIPGLVTGLVPALLRDFTGPTAVIVATSPAILLLGSAWGLQVLAKRPILRRVRGYELTVGITMGAVGLTLLTVGALARSLPLVYLGCAVAAGGPALGYRGGMVLLTRGLDPAAQGAATSRYAATSYGVSACVVLGAGAIGALGGMVTAVTVGAGLLALVAFALLATILATEPPRRTARAAQAVRVVSLSGRLGRWCDYPADRFSGDAAGLGCSICGDADGHDHLEDRSSVTVGDGRLITALARTELAARQRSREAHLVQAVVDAHGHALEPVQPAHQHRQQRQGEEAVGDPGAERSGRRPFLVQVDPLVVVRRVGEGLRSGSWSTRYGSPGPMDSPTAPSSSAALEKVLMPGVRRDLRGVAA